MRRTYIPSSVSLAMLLAATIMGGTAHGQPIGSAHTGDRFATLPLSLAISGADAPACHSEMCEPRALYGSVLMTPMPPSESVALESDLAVLLAAQMASQWATWAKPVHPRPADSQPTPAQPASEEPTPETLSPPPATDEQPAGAEEEDDVTFGHRGPLPFDPETGRVYGYGPGHPYDVVIAYGDPAYDEVAASRMADLPYDPETGRVHGYGPDHQYDVVIGYPIRTYRDAIAWIRQLNALQLADAKTESVSDFAVTPWAMRCASRWAQSPLVTSARHWATHATAAAGDLFVEAQQNATVRTLFTRARQLAQQVNDVPPLPEYLDADLYVSDDAPIASYADHDLYGYERFTGDEAIERNRPALPAPMDDAPMLNAALAINNPLEKEVAAERNRQFVKRFAHTLNRAGTALHDLSRYLTHLLDKETQPPFPHTANGERQASAR